MLKFTGPSTWYLFFHSMALSSAPACSNTQACLLCCVLLVTCNVHLAVLRLVSLLLATFWLAACTLLGNLCSWQTVIRTHGTWLFTPLGGVETPPNWSMHAATLIHPSLICNACTGLLFHRVVALWQAWPDPVFSHAP